MSEGSVEVDRTEGNVQTSSAHSAADFASVALVGFGSRIPRNLRGVISNCGWTALVFPDADVAVSVLRRTLRVDVIVIDARAAACQRSDAVEALLSFAVAAPWDGVPLPVVLVDRTPSRIRGMIIAPQSSLHILKGPGTHYEKLGQLVRELCHLPGRCCCSRPAH